MCELPEQLFANPAWHALNTRHRHLALRYGAASRYSADVAPFAAVAEPSAEAFRDLHALLEPGEPVWIAIGDYALPREFAVEASLECLQMALPQSIATPETTRDHARLSARDARAMVALTDIAFPGFFRPHSYRMGRYYGMRGADALIAMGGERFQLEGFPEISAVCTHPAHRGQGLASDLIWRLVGEHRRAGLVSWLHVGCENLNAIRLYTQLGFVVSRTIEWRRIARAY
jgi:predicted GNAT family acetyltransferase